MEHLQNYGYPWWLVVSSPLQRYYTVNEDHHIPRITLKTEKYLWNYLRTPAWLSKGCAVLPCLTSFRQRHGTSSGKWSELGVQSNNFGHVGTKPSNLEFQRFCPRTIESLWFTQWFNSTILLPSLDSEAPNQGPENDENAMEATDHTSIHL